MVFGSQPGTAALRVSLAARTRWRIFVEAVTHYENGNALYEQGRMDEAIAQGHGHEDLGAIAAEAVR